MQSLMKQVSVVLFNDENKGIKLLHVFQLFMDAQAIKLTHFPELIDQFIAGEKLTFLVDFQEIDGLTKGLNQQLVSYSVIFDKLE